MDNYQLSLIDNPKLSFVHFYYILVTSRFQPSFTKLAQITPYFAKNIVKIHTTSRPVMDKSSTRSKHPRPLLRDIKNSKNISDSIMVKSPMVYFERTDWQQSYREDIFGDYPLDKERSLIKQSEAQILKIEKFENHTTRTLAPHNSCTAFHIDLMVNAIVSKGERFGPAYCLCLFQTRKTAHGHNWPFGQACFALCSLLHYILTKGFNITILIHTE